MKLDVGDKAPIFSALDQHEKTISLSDFKGKKIILYFYPKDMTSGCTVEACEFRDLNKQLAKANTVVLGVSTDDVASHKKFAEKYDLPFSLLADTDKKIVKAYGVFGKKKFMGGEYDGIFRTTFLINEQGIISKIFEKVKAEGHAKKIMGELS